MKPADSAKPSLRDDDDQPTRRAMKSADDLSSSSNKPLKISFLHSLQPLEPSGDHQKSH